MDPEGSRIQDDPYIQVMMAGSTLRKVKSRSWKKNRYFRLLEDGLTIWYKSRWAGRGHSTFSVTDLEAVREGHQSEVLLSIAEEFPAELCFTLVFHGRQGNLDLVAESPDEAQAWIQGVRMLIHKAQTMDEKERLDQWVWDWFHKADKNKDGKMNFKEVKKLLKMMNVEMNEDHALHLFTVRERNQRLAPSSDFSSLKSLVKDSELFSSIFRPEMLMVNLLLAAAVFGSRKGLEINIS
ncbi:1-phosphatidylinositol 4,5-bisphosphate phosphodiesterase delta-4 [Haplochromis burtoni]|uniref:1-phosphatidylinositol 4,5-bisphosphate phosphodiesterase delta-4 n=1 Tax=Haplochromis burtoni TaxID=8153 RepID=UPI001C2D0B5B|nr:1-phosphatidylinositol 4,5-bisphosphate phosphodiesterase delta-4 [Haplochromis burtoni]